VRGLGSLDQVIQLVITLLTVRLLIATCLQLFRGPSTTRVLHHVHAPLLAASEETSENFFTAEGRGRGEAIHIHQSVQEVSELQQHSDGVCKRGCKRCQLKREWLFAALLTFKAVPGVSIVNDESGRRRHLVKRLKLQTHTLDCTSKCKTKKKMYIEIEPESCKRI